MTANIAIDTHVLVDITTGVGNAVIGCDVFGPCKSCYGILHKYKPSPKNITEYISVVLPYSKDGKLNVYYQYERPSISPKCMHYKSYNQEYKKIYRQWLELYSIYRYLSKEEPVYKDLFFNIIQYYIPLILQSEPDPIKTFKF